MRITDFDGDYAILKELGARVRQLRIDSNITQEQLAKKCGISTSTEIRIENGEDTKLSNFIKVVAALGLAENFDTLIPEVSVDYKAIFEGVKKKQRARASKENGSAQWIWGEDASR